MAIDYFDVGSVARIEAETQSPLIVDTDAVLPQRALRAMLRADDPAGLAKSPVSRQMQLLKFAHGNRLNYAPAHYPASGQKRRIPAFEIFNQDQ
ncbi:hypothetical protein [Pandoraea sp. NPDC087047]|uniref:hypothetical protein n=1 Tax=Pandoraea sp. NPDC087047 TaxID=3364390 RepID=UPI003811A5C0